MILYPRDPGGAVDMLSSLTRLGVRPSSSSAEGRLGRPCHPGRGISLGQRLGYSDLTKKKKKHNDCLRNSKEIRVG